MHVLLLLSLLFVPMLPAAAPPRAKAAAAVPDASIEQKIRARFAKSKVSEDKFTVRVQAGVAIIEGSTSVIQRKGVATRLAKAGGAISVDNRIRIAEDARSKAAEKLRESKSRPLRPTDKPVTPAAKPADPAPPPQAQGIPRAQVKH